jgi:pSer/pThr/pTyr-binding forkhead associated (FHA) protein
MDVTLVIEKGTAKKQTLRLRNPDTIIGRQKGCDLRIPSAIVSRRHCLLRFRDDCLTVEDLDSSNGTFLNGERVSGKEVVRPGDRLEIGPLVLLVQYQLTQAAIDRLLRGEGVADDDAEELVEALPLVEEDPNTVRLEDAVEPILTEPEEVIEAAPILDDAEGWQLPEADDLRNILSRMDGK